MLDYSSNLCIVLVFLTWSVVVHGEVDLKILFENESCADPINCPYVPKGRVLPQPSQCCRNLTQAFHCSWRSRAVSLTSYLQSLQSWNCSEELERECKERAFAWTGFTENVYLSFCDRVNLHRKCLPTVQSVIKEPGDRDGVETWENAISKVDPVKLTNKDIIEPCVQIAMYEGDEDNKFVEIFEYRFLVCDLIWNGADISTFKGRDLSSWIFLPPRCKAKMFATATILFILGIIALILNSILISTIITVPTLRHGQYTYRASIAISDCFMAAFIFPSMIYQLYKQTGTTHKFSEVSVVHQNRNITKFPRLQTLPMFKQSYVYTFGIITNIIVFVSVYTLLIAAADRFYAVTWPYKYKRSKAKPANIALVVWFVGMVISLAPFFANEGLKYKMISNAFIMMVGPYSMIVYALMLGLPVPALWILSIFTFISISRSRKRAKSIRARNVGDNNSKEVRLAMTLLFMVGTFTLSMLPAAGAFLYHLTLSPTDFEDPDKIYLDFDSSLIILEWVALMLFLFNTMWNFFIYNARDKEFKAAFHLCIEKLFLAIGCTALHGKLRNKRFQKSTKQSQQSERNLNGSARR